MRIVIVSLNYSPELTGIGRYNGEMAQWLRSKGDEVRVICAPPYYPAWKIAAGFRRFRYAVERDGTLQVVRVPTYVPARPTGLRRLAHLVSFALSSAPVILGTAILWRPDWIFVTEPPLSATPAVLLAALVGRTRTWLHVQDLEVDAAFGLGLIRGRRLREMFHSLERMLMRRFDGVSTISAQMQRRLGEKGVRADRLTLFPNWTDCARIRPTGAVSSYRPRLGISENQCVCLYSGTLGTKQGIDLLFEAFALVPAESPLVLVICGEGPSRPLAEAYAARDPRVRLLPLQPYEALGELMLLADIQLLPQKLEAQDLVMPSKIPTMMASGRPVVASAMPDSELAAVLEGAGIVVPPGNAAALAQAICQLGADRPLREKMGQAGRERAQRNWDRDSVLSAVRAAWAHKD